MGNDASGAGWKTLVYATGNPAKLRWMRGETAPLGLTILGLADIPNFAPLNVDENGKDPMENARIKAVAYFAALREQTGMACPVFSCDSGLYIRGLSEDEQPGVLVRNVGGKRLNDDEMIAHYAGIARRLGGQAFARYRNAICLVVSETETYEHSGEDIASVEFIIADKPHHRREAGFPLDALSVDIASGKYYYDIGNNKYMLKSGYADFISRALKLPEGSR